MNLHLFYHKSGLKCDHFNARTENNATDTAPGIASCWNSAGPAGAVGETAGVACTGSTTSGTSKGAVLYVRL